MSKLFATLSILVSVLHDYFNNLTKLFLNLYLAKFLDISAKLIFPCKTKFNDKDMLLIFLPKESLENDYFFLQIFFILFINIYFIHNYI